MEKTISTTVGALERDLETLREQGYEIGVSCAFFDTPLSGRYRGKTLTVGYTVQMEKTVEVNLHAMCETLRYYYSEELPLEIRLFEVNNHLVQRKYASVDMFGCGSRTADANKITGHISDATLALIDKLLYGYEEGLLFFTTPYFDFRIPVTREDVLKQMSAWIHKCPSVAVEVLPVDYMEVHPKVFSVQCVADIDLMTPEQKEKFLEYKRGVDEEIAEYYKTSTYTGD